MNILRRNLKQFQRAVTRDKKQYYKNVYKDMKIETDTEKQGFI